MSKVFTGSKSLIPSGKQQSEAADSFRFLVGYEPKTLYRYGRVRSMIFKSRPSNVIFEATTGSNPEGRRLCFVIIETWQNTASRYMLAGASHITLSSVIGRSRTRMPVAL